MFQIGDRVESIVDHPQLNADIVIGTQGVVCETIGPAVVGVRWDIMLRRGHSCNGRCDKDHGWRVDMNEIRLVPEQPFVEDESMDDLIRSFRRGAV